MPSRSQAASFNGTLCPSSMSFGFAHGPQSTVGQAEFEGNVQPLPLTAPVSMQIGSSMWRGYVVKQTKRESVEGGLMTQLRCEDWRTNLHDSHFFAMYNMQEEEGRYFHLMPSRWAVQSRAYISKQLNQLDFKKVQNFPAEGNLIERAGLGKLLSAATILNAILKSLAPEKKVGAKKDPPSPFVWTAEEIALQILQTSYPLDLNWNAGITHAAAITQLLEKCCLQWTVFGGNRIHVTLRGASENMFVNQYLEGFANLCQMGGTEGQQGVELDDHGRRVLILGDRNKYEFTFPCRANWNPAWTWQLCYDFATLSALLEAHRLTLSSKLKELPDKYHDLQTWSDGKMIAKGEKLLKQTRNDMKIEDYITKICWHCYVLDCGNAVVKAKQLKDAIDGKYRRLSTFGLFLLGDELPLRKYPVGVDFNSPSFNCQWPLARNLITDSNLQFCVFATSRRIVKGEVSPFADQITLIPKDSGVSLDIEEILDFDSEKFRIRVYFNEPQFFLHPAKDFLDPEAVMPDVVMVTLALEREIYEWRQGEKAGEGIRIKAREQKRSVQNLCKYFWNGEEVEILRENWKRNLGDRGVVPEARPVFADQVAQRIATQLLYHKATQLAGYLKFEEVAGFIVDGLIDTVSVSFDAENGVTENVNFTDARTDDDEFPSVAPLRVSVPFRMEEDLIRDALRRTIKAAMMDKGGVAAHALAFADKDFHEVGAMLGPHMVRKAFDKEGMLSVDMKLGEIAKEPKPVLSPMILGSKEGE